MDEEEVEIWDKKQIDLTVEEYAKIAIGIAFITAAIPAAFAAIGYGVTYFIEKRKTDRLERIVEEFKKENESREQD